MVFGALEFPEDGGTLASAVQRIEHLTTDQKVGGSSPSKRTFYSLPLSLGGPEIRVG